MTSFNKPKSKELLKRAYFLLRLMIVGYRIAYMFDWTDYPSPWFHLIRVKLIRATPLAGANSWWLWKGGILSMVLFFCQFFDWWVNTDFYKRLGKPIVPLPPSPMSPHPEGVGLVEAGKCPICRKQRTNSAALWTGYVFCYPCIRAYIEDYHKCPVTKEPCNLSDIRRIYLVSSI